MKVSKFNISKPIKYTKNNEEKTYWANVGTMTVFLKDDGTKSMIMEIPAIGLNANIFPITPKETPAPAPTPAVATTPAPAEAVADDTIPF